jgi:hypothetical protein
MASAETTLEQVQTATGFVRVEASLVARAREGDRAAMAAIFRHFLPPEEKIYWIGYLGRRGLFFGRHNLGIVTERRIADISIGWLGEVLYQDAFLEYFNSTVFFQPSRLGLFLLLGLFLIAWPVLIFAFLEDQRLLYYDLWQPYLIVLLGAAFGALFIELLVRAYYRIVKCGAVYWIKDGVSIYMFADRRRLTSLNQMARTATLLREQRVQSIGHLG